jgi:hypothetical protein
VTTQTETKKKNTSIQTKHLRTVSVNGNISFIIPRTFNDAVNSFQQSTAVVNMWFAFPAPLSRMYMERSCSFRT